MIRVKTKFTFTGHFDIDVDNENQAKEIVNAGCFMMAGSMSAGPWSDEVNNWDFPMHSEKEILETINSTETGRDAKIYLQLAANSREGKTPIVVWGRDCDNAEATSLSTIDSTIEAYTELYHSVEDSAEGPFTLTIISPEEADEFHPLFRDRAAEQEGY